jgi:hypothetical protein
MARRLRGDRRHLLGDSPISARSPGASAVTLPRVTGDRLPVTARSGAKLAEGYRRLQPIAAPIRERADIERTIEALGRVDARGY